MDFERHVRRNPLCFGGSCPRGHISKRREGGSKRKRVEKKAVRQDSRQGRTKKRRRKRGTERERERKSGKAMQKREGERVSAKDEASVRTRGEWSVALHKRFPTLCGGSV